jgi:hypothetical protein
MFSIVQTMYFAYYNRHAFNILFCSNLSFVYHYFILTNRFCQLHIDNVTISKIVLPVARCSTTGITFPIS